MNCFSRVSLCAAMAGVITFTSVGARAQAPASQPGTQELINEVRALRNEVQQLKAQSPAGQSQNVQAAGTSATSSASVDAAQQAVQHDADVHSTPLTSDLDGFMAGYSDNRFVVQSADGNFKWKPWLHMQLRDVTLWRSNFKANGEDETDNGFELRRMRFGFDGNLFSPNLTYLFNWATNRANGSSNVTNAAGVKIGTVSNNLGGVPLLEEAWVKYRLKGTDIYLKGGQIKDPIEHDQIVSSKFQQSSERSLTGDVFFNGDAFTEGVTVGYDPKTWVRLEAGVNHGIRSANTNFLDYPTNAFNWGVVGRAEFKLMGRWEDYQQVGAIGVKKPLLVVGVGTDYSEREAAGQTVGAVDAMYADPSGLSLFGIVADRYTTHNFGIYTQSPTGASIGTPDPAVAGKATNEYSLVAQAGYIINGHWEPFGRFEYMSLKGTAAGSHNNVQAITAGLNYYFLGNRAKFTTQATWLPHGIPIDDGPNDIYASPSGHQEVTFGAQFQLLL